MYMITVALVCHPGVAVGDAHSHRKAAENLLIVMEVDKSFPKLAEQLVESQLKQNPQLTPHRDVFQRFFTKYLNWAQVKEDTITHTGHIRSGMHRAQRAWYPARVIGRLCACRTREVPYGLETGLVDVSLLCGSTPVRGWQTVARRRGGQSSHALRMHARGIMQRPFAPHRLLPPEVSLVSPHPPVRRHLSL